LAHHAEKKQQSHCLQETDDAAGYHALTHALALFLIICTRN
jgi:hypothetical protein